MARDKTKSNCCNCGGDGTVPVSVNCPMCKGNDILEIDALRELNNFMRKNVETRSRPPLALLVLLDRIAMSQNKPLAKPGSRYGQKN